MKGTFVQNRPRNSQFSLQPEKSNPNITSAVGIQETAGSLRAKRHSLFTQTVIWVTGVICMAFLLGSLAQAWSNSQLAQKVQAAQQELNQLKDQQEQLKQLVSYYNDPAVIEREARTQLGYIRPKEHLVVVVGPNTPSLPSAPKQTVVSVQNGFWLQWWNIFFGA